MLQPIQAVADDGRVAAAFGPPAGEIVGQQLLAGVELRHGLVNFLQLVLARLAFLLRRARLVRRRSLEGQRLRSGGLPMPFGALLQALRQRTRQRVGELGGLGADAPLDRLEARAQLRKAWPRARHRRPRCGPARRRHERFAAPLERRAGDRRWLLRSAAISSHSARKSLPPAEAIEQRLLRDGRQGAAGRRGKNIAVRLLAPALETLRIDGGAHQHMRRRASRGRRRAAP